MLPNLANILLLFDNILPVVYSTRKCNLYTVWYFFFLIVLFPQPMIVSGAHKC